MQTTRQQRRNRLHLADMLENRIKPHQFDMRQWTNMCGTVGCALGIAVMSGEFGYGWNIHRIHGQPIPVRYGNECHWHVIGPELFGDKAHEAVLMNLNPRTRHQVARELRGIK